MVVRRTQKILECWGLFGHRIKKIVTASVCEQNESIPVYGSVITFLISGRICKMTEKFYTNYLQNI